MSTEVLTRSSWKRGTGKRGIKLQDWKRRECQTKQQEMLSYRRETELQDALVLAKVEDCNWATIFYENLVYLEPLWHNRPAKLSNSVIKRKIRDITPFKVIQGFLYMRFPAFPSPALYFGVAFSVPAIINMVDLLNSSWSGAPFIVTTEHTSDD